MAIFNCKVITPQGQVITVKIEEQDRVTCVKKLKRNGMTPIDIKEGYFRKKSISQKINSTIYAHKKGRKFDANKVVALINDVSLKELEDFTKSLYILKKSDFTTEHALITIINNIKNEYFKLILRELLESYNNDQYLYKTMRKYPNVFPVVYINYIKTGELTNSLEESLKFAITYLENEKKIKNTIKTELIPSLLILLSVVVLTFISMVLGVPFLQKMLSVNNSSLPKTTIMISTILGGFVEYWYVFATIIIIMLCIIIKYVSTENGKKDLDNLKYNNFLFGKIWYLLDFSRVIRSIYSNLKNNMRIQDALEISKSVTHNVEMHNTIEKAINNIYVGKSWIEPFEDEGRISTVIIELLKKGFKNKKLHIIDRLIEYIDKEIEEAVSNTIKKVSIISYAIIGVSIFIFICLVFIPYIQIYLSELLFL